MFGIIMGIFAAVLVVAAVYTLFLRTKLRREGIETEAVVSVVKAEYWTEVGSMTRYSDYVVTYLDETGAERKASLANPKRGLRDGSRCRILYDPAKPGYALLKEVLDE